jgi:hypothetical protein
MTLVVKGAAPKEFVNEKNGEFTAAMQDAIKDALLRSKVYFEYIKCADKNNLPYSLHAAVFILK